MDPITIDAALGRRVSRALAEARSQQGITLECMATMKRGRLAHGNLYGRVESGQTKLRVEHLADYAKALGLRITITIEDKP